MIDLAQRSEPYEIALPYGPKVAVKPLTTAGMAATQAAARRVVEAIDRQVRERAEAGLTLDGLPDLSTGGHGECAEAPTFVRSLQRLIDAWPRCKR